MRECVLRYGVAVLLLLAAPLAVHAQDADELLQLLNQLEDMEALQDPAEVMTWVTVPRSAAIGEEVTLQITIENARREEEIRLSSIDISDDFLGGFEILGFEPEPRHQDRAIGLLSLEYPLDIPAGQSRDFELRLKVVQAGVYIGDVDIYEGEQFLTRVAQMRVPAATPEDS